VLVKSVIEKIEKDDIREVIETLVAKEVQVETKDGDCYLTRIMPYRTIDNKIEGVVVTFSNISALMHTIQELKTTKNEASVSD
jgi:two-component system CheB/CheR fusion protein